MIENYRQQDSFKFFSKLSRKLAQNCGATKRNFILKKLKSACDVQKCDAQNSCICSKKIFYYKRLKLHVADGLSCKQA